MGAAYNFDAHFGNPGMGTAIEEVQTPTGLGWGKPFSLQFKQARIDGTARDAGNTGYTDVLRPGLLLGQVFSTGKLKQWSPTATDGSHRIAGILYQSLKMTQGGEDTDRFFSVIVGGSLPARGLCVASSANYGIDGLDDEYVIRAMLAPACQLVDDVFGYLTGQFKGVMILTATATLSELHLGSHLVVRGASAAVTLTLPATPKRGMRFRVTNASAQNLTIAAGTADTMVCFNDLTADSVTLSTAGELIGGTFEVFGDGTGWIVVPALWEGQTPTIVT